MSPSARSILGTAGEAAAAAWLEARGYEILARNVRTRCGEIDLVARTGDLVVFIEVKSRTSTRFGHPSEAIAGRKQRRLARLAAGFMRDHGLGRRSARFDAVAIQFDATGTAVLIEHIPDAFRPEA